MYLTYKVRMRHWWEAWTHANSMVGGAWLQIKAMPITHTCKAHPGHSITLVTEGTPTMTGTATMSTANTGLVGHRRPPQAMGQRPQPRLRPVSTHGMTLEA